MPIPDRDDMRFSAPTTSGKACLWCQGETSVRYHLPRIPDHPDSSLPHEIRWCDACDFGFLDPRPTAEELERLSDRAYRANDSAQQAPNFLEKVRTHLAWRLGHSQSRQIDAPRINSIVGKPHASICIFGWDEMETIVGLKHLGHKVLGVDCSAIALLRARDQGIDVFKGSAEALPPEILETSFDAVFLSNALSGCLEPRVALENAHRLLQPGGHLFAEAPNHDA
jgi:SAM-dependent methyltransferase